MIEARTILAAVAVAAAIIGMPALATAQSSTTRNVDQVTCKEIMQASEDGRTSAIAFLHGYLLGKSGGSSFDIDALAKQTDSFIDQCLDNPKEKAITVMMKSK